MTSIGRSVGLPLKGDGLPLSRRLRGWLRLAGAVHGLAFFLVLAIAPHSHVNSLDDLLTDGPSDSGIFYETTSPATAEPGVWFRAARLVDDDPCLACFQNDFQSATEPVSALILVPTFSPLAHTEAFYQPDQSGPPVARSRSRAPPVAA